MKTAISLPDELFKTMDALARRLDIPRSRLVATAVTEFIARQRTGKVTERLDAVYSTQSSEVDSKVAAAQRRVMRRSEW